MTKFNLKSHLTFNRSEQGGIFFLTLLIVVLLSIYLFVDFSSESVFDVTSSEIVQKQHYLDSLRCVEQEARKPKIYPFNPNFITDYKAYTLKMPPESFDKLKAFREKDLWIHSVTDFKRVTGVSDVWLDSISPYFKFPEWITNPKPNYTSKYKNFRSKNTLSEKTDLNTATEEELQEVSGIGPALSKRVISYRDKLGGFTEDVQLYDVYGLSSTVVARVKERFTVKTPRPITPINVNTATASDLATIPGVSFELGKDIWEFVRLREGLTTLSELEKIDGMTANKLQRIQLYLSVE